MNREQVNKLKYMINKKKTMEEMIKELDVNENELIGVVTKLKEQGYGVDYINGKIMEIKSLVINSRKLYVPNLSQTLKLLIYSDPHFCSKYDRMDIIRYIYKKADDLGVKHAICVGDVTDGNYPNRQQHIYELRVHGFDAQKKYVVNKLPRFGGKTYTIGGNHDFTHMRNDGADIVKAIANERDDVEYLGQDVGRLKIGKLDIQLWHGAGKAAYSRMYKMQRYAERLPIDDLPNILLSGHTHNSGYLYYMGMHCLQVGALLDPTPFSQAQGFSNEKSCYWVDVEIDKKGKVQSVKPELEVFTKKLVR